MINVSMGRPTTRETSYLSWLGRPNQYIAPNPIRGRMMRKVAALEKALKNQIANRAINPCNPPPKRGQEIEINVTLIKMSIGLRYCTNIIPRFDHKDSKYQPSWKFSIMPQNAHMQVIMVDNPTAIQPIICLFLDRFFIIIHSSNS